MERLNQGNQIKEAIGILTAITPKFKEVQPRVYEEAKGLANKCYEIEDKLGVKLFDKKTVASRFQLIIHREKWPVWADEHKPLLAFHIRPEKRQDNDKPLVYLIDNYGMWKIRLEQPNGLAWNNFIEKERQSLTADEFTNSLVQYINNVLMSNAHSEKPYNVSNQLVQLKKTKIIFSKFQDILKSEKN